MHGFLREHCYGVTCCVLHQDFAGAKAFSHAISGGLIYTACNPGLVRVSTLTSLCNGCFGYQETCPYIKLWLQRDTSAIRMQ